MPAPDSCDLDQAVFAAASALEQREVPSPSALLLSRTGLGLLPGRLRNAGKLPLERVPGVPATWREALLHWGELEGLRLWLLEDRVAPLDAPAPAWERAWPVWLAAACGAATLLCCTAAASLGELAPGTIALASDHLNLSGSTPLVGLGASRLGPMFPDQSKLHDASLRAVALEACEQLGLVGVATVVACVPGPALETPAEQRWYAVAGAGASVQGLADPLLAAAHAGLSTLVLAPIVVQAGEHADIARLAATAQRIAPALEDLLLSVASAAGDLARRALEEGSP